NRLIGVIEFGGELYTSATNAVQTNFSVPMMRADPSVSNSGTAVNGWVEKKDESTFSFVENNAVPPTPTVTATEAASLTSVPSSPNNWTLTSAASVDAFVHENNVARPPALTTPDAVNRLEVFCAFSCGIGLSRMPARAPAGYPIASARAASSANLIMVTLLAARWAARSSMFVTTLTSVLDVVVGPDRAHVATGGDVADRAVRARRADRIRDRSRQPAADLVANDETTRGAVVDKDTARAARDGVRIDERAG